MRNFLYCLFAVCVLISCPALAQQDWKKITFEGNIITQTCEAKINGAEDATVKLPDVRDKVLDGDDIYAGLATFTIGISNCLYGNQNGVQKVKMFVRVPSGQNLYSNALVNMYAPESERAKGVWLRVYEDSAAVKEITLDGGGSVVNLDMQIQDGQASHILSAQYYARKSNIPIKPGKFSAAIEYRLEYL